MKITVISSQVFPVPCSGYSGLEQLAWLQARGLAERGHSVTLIAPEGSWCPNVQMIHVGPPGAWSEMMAYGGDGKTWGGYWKQLIGQEVIIDNSWQKNSYLLKMEGVLKAPVLGVCHAPVNTMFSSLPAVDKPSFVCISQDQANHFQALYGRPARVAYNGVDPEFYKPISMPRSNRFLFLARFSSIKGPDIAIEACLQAGVGLDLVGDTSITNEPELYHKCKKMADGKQIRIIGNQNRGSCVWWFSQAHALIHPNQRFREPFGLAPVEAMACGCPVISWNHGAMAETVKHGETGWLVDSVEQLKAVIDQVKSGAYNQPGVESRAKCREHAKKFSVERMIQRYHELCVEAHDTGGW